MDAENFHRFSRQPRPLHPEDGNGSIHPRCLEMAETMRDLFAAGGGVRAKDLVGAGFTWAEIAEYRDEAAKLAGEASVRHLSMRPDALEDVIQKAREAIANRLPLPRGTSETQVTIVAWNNYCRARQALTLYPWASLREECLRLLRLYLDHTAMFEPSKRTVIEAVAIKLPQVMN
jgi:hypothetical protein